MEADPCSSLLLPLGAGISAGAVAALPYALSALLLVLAALWRYAHLVSMAHPHLFRSERLTGEERNGRRATARPDRLPMIRLAFGLASAAALAAALLIAGRIVGRIPGASLSAWFGIIVASLLLGTGVFALDVLLRKASEARQATRPGPGLWFAGTATLFLFFPLVLPVARLTAPRALSSSRPEADEATSAIEEVETGVLEEDEEQLGDYIAEFRETEVREIMTSRMDIIAIPCSATLSEAVEVFERSGHSRLPLFRDHLDHVEGILYVKDLLPLLANRKTERPDWTLLARSPLVVPMNLAIEDLLRDFKSKRTHVAIVTDEYGGTEGLVTLEDILEELVGDIRDEYDIDEPDLFERLDASTFRFDARIDLDEFALVLESVLGEEEAPMIDTDAFDFESLGGLLQHLSESVPISGTEVELGRLRMTVDDVEQHRIGHVIVHVRQDADESEGDGGRSGG